MPVAVLAPRDVGESLLRRIWAETDAIWKPAGVTFEWHRVDAAEAASSSWLDVTIDERRQDAVDEGPAVLGWIRFTGGHPERSIYLSRLNVEALLRQETHADDMTIITHEALLGRALGRALAHELGHYLLRSKVHSRHGVMRATRAAEDFFRAGREGFDLSAEQRDAAARQVRQETPATGDV